jgi:hypothetical protein
MDRFKDGLHVKVWSREHPLDGMSGRVARLRRADNGAWVEMDEPLPIDLRRFPEGDSRTKHILLYPDECVSVAG